MRFNLRRRLQNLGPHMSLLALAAPTAAVECLKLAAVFFLGDGHWATGLMVLLCAYMFSLFVTERLFKIVRPKLMMLPWFKTAWRAFESARQKTFRWLRSKWALTRDVGAISRGSHQETISRLDIPLLTCPLANGRGQHDDFGAGGHAVVKVDDVVIKHADAA